MAGEGTSSRIVFALRNFPDFALDSENEDWIRVPLTWMLALQSAGDDRLQSSWADFTLADHVELHAELQQGWGVFKAYANCPDQDGMFVFEYWQTHLLYVRTIVRRLLDEFKPVAVAFPQRDTAWFVECGNDEERLSWLTVSVIAEETTAVPHRVFVEGPSPSVAQGSRLRSDASRLKDRIARIRLRLSENRSKRILSNRRGRLGTRQAPKVLVVAQRAKVTEIFNTASQRKYLRFIPYEHLEALYPAGSEHPPNRYSSAPEPAQMQLWHWLRERASISSATLELERDVLTSPPKALITDARHDPKIRALVRACTKAGVQVAIIPEGAAVGVGEHSPFWESLRLVLPEVTYFLLTDEEEKLYLQLGASPDLTHVTGYLGDTRFPSKKRALLGAWTEVRERRFVRQASRSRAPVVGVTLDLLGSARAMSIPGAPPALQSLAAYKNVLSQLSLAGFPVVVAARDPVVATLFRTHFALPNVVYLSTTPWQWIARNSQVMVSWLSSVAWECGVLGVPVVVPRFGDVPSIAEVTLRSGRSRLVTVAHDPLQIVSDVEKAAASRRPWERFEAPVNACHREIVSRWIGRAVAAEGGQA